MDARGGDAGERPAPSGVQGGDDPAFHVNHQEGHTIGGENAEGETGGGDHPVALGANVCRADDCDLVASGPCGCEQLTGGAGVAFRAGFARRKFNLRRIDPRRIDAMDEVAVDLADADDRQVRMEQMPSAPVLGDGVGRVADPSGEIEGRERTRADAAGAAAETMDEAGDVPRGHQVRPCLRINLRGDGRRGGHARWPEAEGYSILPLFGISLWTYL